VSTPDAGRLASLVFHDIGMDVPGMLKELEAIPERIHEGKRRLLPLKAELDDLRERYQSRAQQPSQADLERRVLLSEIMEEERVLYNRDPDFATDAKGNQKKIELTDGRAENRAHAHPRYRAYVERMREERKRMAQLSAQCREIYDVCDRHKMRMGVLQQKLQQAGNLEKAWSAEAYASGAK
jgi:chromosome segregation ATPase